MKIKELSRSACKLDAMAYEMAEAKAKLDGLKDRIINAQKHGLSGILCYRGTSLRQAAKIMGVSPTYLSMIGRGKVAMSPAMASKLVWFVEGGER